MPRQRVEDEPQFPPGASQYLPQTLEDDDGIEREFASEFEDRIDPETSDAEGVIDDDGSVSRRDLDRLFPSDDTIPE